MRLRTLGKLTLEGAAFKRAKPLLLLAYLAVEGPKERWFLKELFWRDAKNAQSSLSTALAQLRKAGPDVVGSAEARIWSEVESDTNELLAALDQQQTEKAMELYGGAFLAGVDPSAGGVELEEWIYATRESLGSRVRQALLSLGEERAAVGKFGVAAELALRAYLLPGAPEPELDELERLHVLFRAGEHPEAAEVTKEAAGYDLELNLSVDDARAALQRSKSTTNEETLVNLPAQATRFIGRQRELSEVSELLMNPDCRLLTLVGGGGLGKTRLALEAAQEQHERDGFVDGVMFVALEAVTSAASFPAVVAGALGLTLSGQEDASGVVLSFLADKRLLLLLDNFEQLLEGVGFVRELTLTCPGLKVMVTSRERLNLQHEWVSPVEGLAYPPEPSTPERAESFDAVQLFLQRSRQAQPGFSLTSETLPAVVRICQLVEGMPLAIELASSWLRALPVGDIAVELEAGLDLLESSGRDVPERHRGVRVVFDHSWSLLTQQEREVLRRLSVFRGGFRREAASVVAGTTLPLLARLVDKSLLRMSPEGRYDRHPLLAQYTREKLAELLEERAEVEQRHGSYYLGLVRELEPDLWTLRRRETLGVFLGELANIRAAWEWAASNLEVDEIELGTPAMFDFFTIRLTEGLEYFGTAFEFFGGIAARLDEGDPKHGGALGTLLIHQVFKADIMHRDRDRDLERLLAERGVSLLESVGEPRALARGLYALGESAGRGGGEAMEWYERALALARKHRSASDIAHVLWVMGWALKWGISDPGKHKRFVEDALGELRALGHLPGVAYFLLFLGYTLETEQRFEEAKALFVEAKRLADELGHHEIVINALTSLTDVSIELGELDRAAAFAGDAYRRAEEVGLRFFLPDTLGTLAAVALARGDVGGTRELLRRQLEVVRVEWRGDASVLYDFSFLSWAELLAAEGSRGKAVTLLAHVVGAGLGENQLLSETKRVLVQLEGSLTPEEFAAAVERGREMSLEDVRDELTAFSAGRSSM